MWSVSGFLLLDHSIQACLFLLWKPGWTQQHESQVNIMRKSTTALQYMLPIQSWHEWSSEWTWFYIREHVLTTTVRAFLVLYRRILLMILLQNRNTPQFCSVVIHNNLQYIWIMSYLTEQPISSLFDSVPVTLYSNPISVIVFVLDERIHKPENINLKIQSFGFFIRDALYQAWGTCPCHLIVQTVLNTFMPIAFFLLAARF